MSFCSILYFLFTKLFGIRFFLCKLLSNYFVINIVKTRNSRIKLNELDMRYYKCARECRGTTTKKFAVSWRTTGSIFVVGFFRWNKEDEDPEVGLSRRRYVDDGEDLDDTH